MAIEQSKLALQKREDFEAAGYIGASSFSIWLMDLQCQEGST